jgi:hypothetical protein
MEGHRVARKVGDWIPNWKRKLRRPKLRWKDKVKQEDRHKLQSLIEKRRTRR